MAKLKLNLDEIKVESFETNDPSISKNGTVHGNLTGTHLYCGCGTEAGTCLGTCMYQDNTCQPTVPCAWGCNATNIPPEVCTLPDTACAASCYCLSIDWSCNCQTYTCYCGGTDA